MKNTSRTSNQLGPISTPLVKHGGPYTESDGSICWYKHGKLHREDGPAYTIKDELRATYQWFKDGELHRDGDEIAVFSQTSYCMVKSYYKEGKLHRENGPAHIYMGTNIHSVYTYYYLNGKVISKIQWKKRTGKKLNIFEHIWNFFE